MLPERRLCQLHPGLPRFVFDFRFADYSVKDTLWGVKFAENALSGMLAPIYSAWHGRLGHDQVEHHFPRAGHPCHELCAHQVKLALRVPHKFLDSNRIDWFLGEQYRPQCNVLESPEPA